MPILKEIINRTLESKNGAAAYAVIETLTNTGYEAWWVGGCVRDMLLGAIPKDIDIAVSAHPEQITALFPNNDGTAAALGSVVIAFKGCRFEITTFREDDSASDGRHPQSVRFGTLEQDSIRRDLTVNAMYWHPITRGLFDPHHGEGDLKEKLIRIIGDPNVRITHDALRILRAVRFRALINGQYHPNTYHALQKNAPLISGLSGMRQLQELEKMLAHAHPELALQDLWETGILKLMLPELYACRGVAQPVEYHREGDVWNHLVQCTSQFSDDHGPDVRLAALFHDCGKVQTFAVKERIRFDHHAQVSADTAKIVFDRLQLQSDRRDKICWLIRHHMMMTAFFDLSEQRKGHWYHHPWFSELLQLFYLDIAGTTPADFALYDHIIDDYNAFLDAHPRPEKPLLSGNEVMEILGIAPGEEVGRALHQLHEEQMKKRITKKAEAKKFLLELHSKNA